MSPTDPQPQAQVPRSRLTPWFATRQVEEASGFIARAYDTPHSLELRHDRGLDVRLCGFDVGRLNVSTVEYGVPAIAWVEASRRTAWMFSTALDGSCTLGRDPTPHGAGEAAVYAPSDTHEIRMDAHLRLLNLKVEQDDMAAACRAMLGSDLAHGLHFAPLQPAAQAGRPGLRQLLARLEWTPRYAHPAAARLEQALQDAALYELLLLWPHSYSPYLDDAAALPRSTRVARDYIHAHAAELPTLAQIAAAAGVGTRALNVGFQRHLKCTPMRYLLQCRLDGVRSELLHGEAGDTVTAVAMQWGFFNLGDFAAHYQVRFGERPSQTLRRARH